MRKKPDILYEWKIPKEAALSISQNMTKGGWIKLLRMAIIICVLDIVAYLVLNIPLLKETGALPDNCFSIFFKYAIVALCLCCYSFILDPYLLRYSKNKYQITEEGIWIKSGTEIIKWDMISNYRNEHDEAMPNCQTIVYQVRNRDRFLYLPKGELADSVYSTFSQKVTITETKRKEHLKLNKGQIIYLVFICVLYASLSAYFTAAHPGFLKEFGIYFLYFTLLLGPGILGMVTLLGFKFSKLKRGCLIALVCNVLTFILYMFLWKIIEIAELYRAL